MSLLNKTFSVRHQFLDKHSLITKYGWNEISDQLHVNNSGMI